MQRKLRQVQNVLSDHGISRRIEKVEAMRGTWDNKTNVGMDDEHEQILDELHANGRIAVGQISIANNDNHYPG